jgi:hypothetical protein
MNALIEIMMTQGFWLDALGVLGLGLVAIAAVRLLRPVGSRGATLMTWGAVLVILGRAGVVVADHLQDLPGGWEIPVMFVSSMKPVQLVLLTVGLGGIVWGFWSHEREVSASEVSVKS